MSIMPSTPRFKTPGALRQQLAQARQDQGRAKSDGRYDHREHDVGVHDATPVAEAAPAHRHHPDGAAPRQLRPHGGAS